MAVSPNVRIMLERAALMPMCDDANANTQVANTTSEVSNDETIDCEFTGIINREILLLSLCLDCIFW